MAGTAPLIDYPNGGSLVEFTKTMDAVLTCDFDTVISGHGAVQTNAELTRAREQMRLRKSKEEIGQIVTANFGWGVLQQHMSLDGMIRELK